MISDEALLTLEHISFSYMENEPVLKDISITFHKGEKIAVLGNNGAGKSTFFLICNGILKPQNGKLKYKTQEITYKKSDLITLRKNIGIVFQDVENQIIASTVESEVAFGPMNLMLGKQEVSQRVEAALLQMDLTDFRQRVPQYLSGGEKKRVTIADILAMNPQIILFDEPTASLDPHNILLLEQTLDRLSRSGITLVISTHDVDFAYQFADRAVIFNHGQIIADSKMENLFSDEQMIKEAGLKKPLLYEITTLLNKKLNQNNTNVLTPKCMSEFNDYLDSISLT